MDDETRAAFERMHEEMRRGFAANDRRFDAMDAKIGAMDTKIGAMDTKIGAMDTKIDAMDTKIDASRREAGVTAEYLLGEIKLVAEVTQANAQAIGRLRDEMNARFRDNEIILRAAFGQIRSDIDELRRRP